MSENAFALGVMEAEKAKLPALPSIIRYLDNFSDTWMTIRSPAESMRWVIKGDGFESNLEFDGIEEPIASILKHWAAWALSHLAAATIRLYFRNLRNICLQDGYQILHGLISIDPLELKKYWHFTILPSNSSSKLSSLKSYLYFCCDMSLGQLSPGYSDFVGAFRMPEVDKYAAVRDGDVFLSSQEEASIVEYLDEVNGRVSRVEFEELRSACILCISYQHAMRPIQIAKVRSSDVKIFESIDNGAPILHITFFRAKQKSTTKRLPTIRTIKREWSHIFLKYSDLRSSQIDGWMQKNAVVDSYFGMTPSSVGKTIARVTESLMGIARPAGHLRHTGAQRMVDAGASEIELAEFMGHSYADTGLVYFDSSPAQANRVNKALALSPIYSRVAEVARTKIIDRESLLKQSPDHHIGGVPHGIPIAGIGSCELGQSLCSKNPVLSCYSCRKFMAVMDVEVHQEVLERLRPVVRFFYDVSRGEENSPAYMQLRRTLESVQAVISQLNDEASNAAK